MLVVDKMSRVPIYEQIEEGIKREIITGILKEREQLPSIRELSVILATNPNTVQKAFMALDRDGIIVSTPGRGCFVAENAAEKIREGLKSKIDDIKSLAAELVNAGISEKLVIEAIKSVYKANK
jgi:GntR family transcriptional regulator